MKTIICFIGGMLCIFLVGFAIDLYSEMIKNKNRKNNILNKYGKPVDISDVDYKVSNVANYFVSQNIKNSIDDITWNDLDFDEIYKGINNTQSSAGRDLLYAMLRTTVKQEDELIKRDNIIEYFEKNNDTRFNVQYILAKLGISEDLYPTSCLFNQKDNSSSKLIKFTILSYIPTALLIASFFSWIFWIPFALSLIYNIWISQSNQIYNYNTEGFNYMISLVNACIKLEKLELKILDENLGDVSKNISNLKKIRRKSLGNVNIMISSDVNVFSEYFKMINLSEIKMYEKVKNTVVKNSEDFIVLYNYIGTIDALISIASFRRSLNYYCKPELKISNKKSDNKIEFIDIYHPLVKDPVVNSAIFDKSSLITGSNASGKSTFIKTIAINAILSQTIYTATANRYTSAFFDVYTSMALKDDIASKESYYIVEIKSLKRIIDNSDKTIPCLCFVDEILRGTNTIERIASSTEVLGFLSKQNTLCFAATHDIELTHILENQFDNYHFEESINDNDITFDYKLHKGRSQSKNAIKLLDFMGYDKNIVNNANKRAKHFLEEGSWEI